MIVKYLLIKRGLYWRPDAKGYTKYKNDAGRYSYDDALSSINDDVTMITEKEAAFFAPAASDLERLDYYKANSDRLEALNAELVDALEKFVNNAHERDVGCGDIVLTTCEVLEEAQQALEKAKVNENE